MAGEGCGAEVMRGRDRQAASWPHLGLKAGEYSSGHHQWHNPMTGTA